MILNVLKEKVKEKRRAQSYAVLMLIGERSGPLAGTLGRKRKSTEIHP